jgi:hypothetical protein
MSGLMVIVAIVMCFGFSWIVTCGIIKLITLCFGLVFTWKIATGIWLVLLLISSVFKSVIKVNKES